MNNSWLFFILFLFMSISPSNAQSLSSHQWKDRIIIIQSDESSSQLLKSQILELKKHEEGLEERRLVIYQVNSDQIKKRFDPKERWQKIDKSFKQIQNPSAGFEIILLGLDGGIKLRKTELLTCDELFRTIDQMPMRRSEIRRKKDFDNFK
ncbi:DUF4174 domain-containing protein [Algoriphagus sp. SE2]|uniref:DUF4174 domain-containing protein n=1 Tax=Algoriphagus sp. SE2 TaxID=3141536 RepID=UPI0031CD8EFC